MPSSDQRKRAVRRWQLRLLRIVGSAVLIAGIFWFIPIPEIATALRELKFGYAVAGFVLILVTAYMQSFQLWLLLRRADVPIGHWKVFETNMITRFYGQFLPSELMAGAVKFYRLAGPGRQWGEVIAAQTCSRLIHTFVLALLGLVFWAIEWPSGAGRWIGVLLVTMTVGLLAVHLFIARPHLGRLVDIALPARVRAWLERSRARKVAEVLRTTAASYRRFGDLTVAIAVIAVFRNLIGIVSFGLLALSVDIRLSYLTIGWIRVVLQAVMTLPIAVSGIGVREGSLVLLLQEYAVPASQAVALSFVLLISSVLSNSVGGALELANLHRPAARDVAGTRSE